VIMAAEKKPDYDILINGLADSGVKPSPTNVKAWPRGLQVGNLWLGFSAEGALVRVRITAPLGELRDFMVQPPQENLMV